METVMRPNPVSDYSLCNVFFRGMQNLCFIPKNYYLCILLPGVTIITFPYWNIKFLLHAQLKSMPTISYKLWWYFRCRLHNVYNIIITNFNLSQI